jgi:DNA-binding NarL/FixJ family response regulator
MKSIEQVAYRMQLVNTLNRFSAKYRLTERESHVLALIMIDGCSNCEIAERCVISEKTVKNHISNIMKKINIRSMRKLFSLLFMNMALDSFQRTGMGRDY